MNTIRSGYRLGSSYWWKHYLDPATYYYYFKYKIQRANRGWADCDTWSLDIYLSEWLPDALRHLKKTKHGVPCDMFKETDDTSNNECIEDVAKRWDNVMDKMILAFEANLRIIDLSYEDELGPWDNSKERFEKTQELIKRDEQIFEEGMELFVKHFSSLWD